MSDSSDDEYTGLPFRIARLTDNNYHIWQFRLKSYLQLSGVWNTITGTAPEESKIEVYHQWRQKDLKAQRLIQLMIDDNQTYIVEDAKSAKEMWNALKTHHEKPSLTKITILWRELRHLRMEDNGDMWDHVGKLSMLFWRLEAIGQKIPESLKVAILMESVPPSYDEYVMFLRYRPEEEQTYNAVEGKLRWEYRRREDSADRENECTFCHRQGHVRKACFKYLRTKGKKNSS